MHAPLFCQGGEVRSGDGQVEFAGEQLLDMNAVVGGGVDDDLAPQLLFKMGGKGLQAADQRLRAVEWHDPEFEWRFLGLGWAAAQTGDEEQAAYSRQKSGHGLPRMAEADGIVT